MKTLGIFCGGFSSEAEISVKSANTIMAALPDQFDTFLIIVSRKSWVANYHGLACEIDLNDLSFEFNGKKIKLDIGLVYIHGNPGENGKIQAFLEMKGLPCVNSGALASELSFDKWYCNQFLRAFDVKVAQSILLLKGDAFDEDKFVSELGLPIFVKPADSGSSYGISKVKAKEELILALDKAFEEGETVVMESFLDGTEVTCGVYRGRDGVVALPITEIVSESDFFDYDAKYLGKSQEITPARISNEHTALIQAEAKRIYQLLRLKSVSRIDFMLVKGVPYVIEVNTTPGFSQASIIPKMLAVHGLSVKDFWLEIIEVEL